MEDDTAFKQFRIEYDKLSTALGRSLETEQRLLTQVIALHIPPELTRRVHCINLHALQCRDLKNELMQNGTFELR